MYKSWFDNWLLTTLDDYFHSLASAVCMNFAILNEMVWNVGNLEFQLPLFISIHGECRKRGYKLYTISTDKKFQFQLHMHTTDVCKWQNNQLLLLV